MTSQPRINDYAVTLCKYIISRINSISNINQKSHFMKKFLLSLATVLCAGSFAMADEVSIDLNSSTGFTGDANAYTATTDGFTFTYEKAGASNDLIAPASDHIRVYKNATFTVKADNGQQMTKIVMTSTGSNYCGFNASSVGDGSWSSTTYTWAGNTTEVTFTAGSTQARIKNITITYESAGAVVVDVPVISPEGGRYSEAQEITITAADGCKIYYTLDGQNPTDDVDDGSTKLYTAPFTVSETTTVKAIAFDADDNKSNIVTETYTIVTLLDGAEGEGTEASPYNTIAAINEANMGTTATIFVQGTIVSISELSTQYGNATYYISPDGTEENQLYIYRGYGLNGEKFTAEDEVKVGDKVVIKGALMLYNNSPQIGSGSSIVKLNDQEAEKFEPTGDGTEENPFTVADVIGINPKNASANEDYPDKYWIKGYIAGACNGQVFADGIIGTTEGITSATNIILAPAENTTEIAECVPVQLPSGSVRTALNLVDNPSNLGKEVLIYGNIYMYFNVAGVKNVTEYKLDSSSVDAIEIEAADAPVEYYNLQGVRVANPENGLYIMRQGDKVTKVIK